MKRILSIFFTLMVLGAIASAQPGGHPGGYPGGRPMGPPPGGFRPGQGPRGDFDPSRMDRSTQQVKQKKVRSGSTFKVVGTLRDSVSKEVLVYVNVAILDSADSSFVKGGSTDFDGAFDIADVPAGTYLMRVSYVGYQTLFRTFRVENNTALGTLFLKPGAATLKTVKITAERPLYAMDGEKMIYNVADDPSIQSGTTSDALQNAPGVEVDIEGNVTLRGVSSVEIWINDKPSKLTAENLKTYLETLPANALDHIETITNPSAKYATTSEAVINIVTSAHIKKNHFISFGLNGASQPSLSPWLSYMWAKERLSVNIFASGRYNYRHNEGNGWTRKFDNNLDTLAYDTTWNESENKRYSGNLFMNINYEIDSMTDLEVHGGLNYSLSNSYSYSGNIRDEHWLNNGAGNVYAFLDSTNSPQSTSGFGSLGANITRKFDDEGHNLRLFADGHFNWSGNDQTFSRTYLSSHPYNTGITYTMPGDDQKLYQTSSTGSQLSLNGRYNRPYSKDGEMSYGLGYGYNHNTTSYMPTANGATDLLRQYDLKSNDHNVDGDVNWTHRFGHFTLELGLGAGLTSMDYAYESDGASLYPSANLADQGSETFFTLTPSIHTSYRTEDLHNFKLNYTLRMNNPQASQLSTRRNYSEDSYRTGNPNLKGSLTHNAEIGWSKYFLRFGNIGIDGYARYSQNEISSLTDRVEDDILLRLIQYSMPENMGSSYRFGTSLNMTYRPSGFFNLRFYGNLYNAGYTYDYAALGKTYSDNMWSYSLRVNAWSKIFNKYQVFASARYTSPTQGLFSTSKARYSMDCGIRSDFFKRKLSVFVNVQDIFNWGKTIGGGSTNTNPLIQSENSSYTLNSRYISAGVTLRFGKMELERDARSGGESTDSE
ncbi:MAG: TonB-dependent receptor family protein [Bacteroidales bacterium]|nr:TonB-dependent receptor family protein [Bacteroidales bacterium]